MDKTAAYYFENTDVVAFPKMGLEFNIDVTAFTVFGFEIRWYGVIIAVGMLLAMLYCFHRMKQFGLDSDRAIDAVLGGLIGAIFGARLYFVAFNSETPLSDFFKIRSGGLAIYGGLIGGLLVALLVSKFRKVKFLPLLDVAGLGFFIGQAIGRWGNFVNKEAFGSATELPWGMASATIQATLGTQSGDVVLAHPCFLYESIWCALGFLFLHFYSKHRKFDGEMFLIYSAWYGFGRFFIEGLRMDSLYIGRLRVSQLLAAICVVAAVTAIFFVRSHIKRNGGTVLYKDTEESKTLLLEAEQRAKAPQNSPAEAPAEAESILDEKSEEAEAPENVENVPDESSESVNTAEENPESKTSEEVEKQNG